MSAITTTTGHVNQALYFYDSDPIYCVLGRQTAWPNEMTPPAPDPAVFAVDEVIGYKKWSTKELVVEDPLGTIPFNGKVWRVVTAANAVAEGARWVYLKFIVYPADMPLVEFRQIGIHDRLEPVVGFESQPALTPAQVDDPGNLILLDNRVKIIRVVDQQEVLEYILEF